MIDHTRALRKVGDTMEKIRSRKSKDKQYNGQTKQTRKNHGRGATTWI